MKITFDLRFWIKLISVAIVAATMMFTAAAVSSAEVRLTGSGATFPFPIYSTWFKDYNQVHKEVQINYQGKGSGAGIKDLQNHTVDFAGSDAAMTDEELRRSWPGQPPLGAVAIAILFRPSVWHVLGQFLSGSSQNSYSGKQPACPCLSDNSS